MSSPFEHRRFSSSSFRADVHAGKTADVASRPSRGCRFQPAAFTLMEVLMVLAIMGLIAAVLVGGASSLLNDKPVSAEEVFWKAVQEARKTALKEEQNVLLKFAEDPDKGKRFVVASGSTTKDFPIPNAKDLEISFLVPQTGGSVVIIAGAVVETQKISAVTFYPDGTCSAFRVQFFRTGTPHIVAIDPWTCAPVLITADDNGGTGSRP